MVNQFLYYIRTLLQLAPLFILLYSLQSHSKKNLKKMFIFFAIIYITNCILEQLQLGLFAFITVTFLTIALNTVLFKKDLIDSSIDYSVFLIVSYPMSLIVELVFTSFGLIKTDQNTTINEITLAIYMVIMILWSVMLYLFVPIRKLLNKYRNLLRSIFLILLNIFIFYFISRQDTISNSSKNVPIYLFSCIALITSSIFLYKEISKFKSREQLIEQHNDHIKIFDSVISDIRCKQHDFKNHLSTLNALCYDKEAFEKHVSSYIVSINKDIANIDYLTGSKNKVLGALLYSKSCDCTSKGIEFSFENHNPDMSLPLEQYDLTSVLSNLIDNAIEALEKVDLSEKKIIVSLVEADNEKYFQVSNTSNPMPPEIVSKLFNKGYTSKEDKIGHGLGLYNVRKTVSKYKGVIKVINNTPYVTFRVSFETLS